MTVSPIGASQAYLNTAKSGNGTGMEPRKGDAGGFARALEEVARSAGDGAKAGEAATFQALAGKAELADVVIAISNAEVALQTVVAVRDRVVQAYQEIIRMPI